MRLPNSNALRSAGQTFDTRLDAERWLEAAVETFNQNDRAVFGDVTGRWLGGLRCCRGCGFDFRPTRRSNLYCDDCTFNNARRAYNMRRARALGTHTADEWQAKQREHGGLCAYCRSAPGVTKDHVVPVSCGGSDSIANIVPACGRCNSSKGARSAPRQPDGAA